VITTRLGPGRSLPVHQPSGVFDPTLGQRAPLRILLAEDNATNQKLAVRLLERFGYGATVVDDGRAAVDAVALAEFDLVLMDVQMPGMDGLEATRRIRAEHGARPWIVALTANTTNDDRAACLQAGMDDYLAKPVRPTELAAALELGYQRGPGAASARRAVDGPAGAGGSGAAGAADTAAGAPPAGAEIDGPAGNGPGTVPSSGAVIDVAALRRLEEMAGDRGFVDELLQEFRQDVRIRTGELEATSGDDHADLTVVRRHAHTLKSSAANVGATTLSARARDLEVAAGAEDRAGVARMLPGLLAAADEALHGLDALDGW
jgi:CheY-like chemotaxis protein